MSDNEKRRHTVEIPTKHLGVGSVLVAAIMVLNPVKEWFFTRDEGLAQAARIERLEQSIIQAKTEIIERIKESEVRSMKNQERIEKRIDRLEASRFKANNQQTL